QCSDQPEQRGVDGDRADRYRDDGSPAANRALSLDSARWRPFSSRGAGRPVLDDERGLVYEAPRPVLTRLERGHDRMPGGRGVLARVFVDRRVAAPHVPARAAHPEMYPARAHLEALLASLDLLRRGDPYPVRGRAARLRPAG